MSFPIKLQQKISIFQTAAINQHINDLKNQLSATDYKVIKCAEYQLAGLEAPYDIITLNTERQLIRDEINTIEATL